MKHPGHDKVCKSQHTRQPEQRCAVQSYSTPGTGNMSSCCLSCTAGFFLDFRAIDSIADVPVFTTFPKIFLCSNMSTVITVYQIMERCKWNPFFPCIFLSSKLQPKHSSSSDDGLPWWVQWIFHIVSHATATQSSYCPANSNASVHNSTSTHFATLAVSSAISPQLLSPSLLLEKHWTEAPCPTLILSNPAGILSTPLFLPHLLNTITPVQGIPIIDAFILIHRFSQQRLLLLFSLMPGKTPTKDLCGSL